LKDNTDKPQFSIVVSNPPYSVHDCKDDLEYIGSENEFTLYKYLTNNSKEIECLFVERTKQLLKPGGIAGIILPSSILSNAGIYAKTREILLQAFEIIAITELGSNTFMATGTNTVVLFLRCRKDEEVARLRESAYHLAKTYPVDKKDLTTSGIVIEKPIAKYLAYTSETEIDAEKLFYFLLAYNQTVVLVKTGEKDAEKRFLGYEFSNRRGSEGIHPIQRSKTIDECTQLFDEHDIDNPQKASTYIYRAFNGDTDSAIDESMKNNVSRVNLVDMLTFDRAVFEKTISLNSKKKLKIESRWEIEKMEDISLMIKRGKSATYGKSNIQIIKSGQARGIKEFDFSQKYYVDESFALDERKLEKGDILINSTGVGTAGRVTLFNLNGTFVVDSHITILRPNKEKVLCDFILQSLVRIGFKNIEAMAKGQSGQIELSLDTIKNIKIPLPPLDIQEKIVAEIEIMEKEERKTKTELEKLKESIKNTYINIKQNFEEHILSNEIEIIGGGTPNTSKSEYWDGNIPWLYIVDF
jgi:type I restriction enzyme M protein